MSSSDEPAISGVQENYCMAGNLILLDVWTWYWLFCVGR